MTTTQHIDTALFSAFRSMDALIADINKTGYRPTIRPEAHRGKAREAAQTARAHLAERFGPDAVFPPYDAAAEAEPTFEAMRRLYPDVMDDAAGHGTISLLKEVEFSRPSIRRLRKLYPQHDARNVARFLRAGYYDAWFT